MGLFPLAHLPIRWTQQQHTGYRYFLRGEKYNGVNEDRINQLMELGFEFKDSNKIKGNRFQNIPDIPFERRLEQVQQFQEQMGHLNVDYR